MQIIKVFGLFDCNGNLVRKYSSMDSANRAVAQRAMKNRLWGAFEEKKQINPMASLVWSIKLLEETKVYNYTRNNA